MKITALIGKSGTGKSHRAVGLAQSKKIDAIIDDGLLIMANKVLAGKSAKKEKTKIASVKRALFYDKDHIKEVKNTIFENKIESILILGTSKEMVDRICDSLEIGKIAEYIGGYSDIVLGIFIVIAVTITAISNILTAFNKYLFSFFEPSCIIATPFFFLI